MDKYKPNMEIVEARCKDEMNFSTVYLGVHYSFNHKEWTKCPMVVYGRNKSRLVLNQDTKPEGLKLSRAKKGKPARKENK